MKIAILYNYLENIGGAEIMCLNLSKHYNADIYTTNINKEKIELMGFVDVLPRIYSLGKVPINPPLRNQLTLIRFRKFKPKKRYDVYIIFGEWAISSSMNCHPNIYYCHSPTREFYDLYIDTKKKIPLGFKTGFDFWTKINKDLTEKYIKNVDNLIANSVNTKKRIKKYLNLDSEIIYPLIETKNFSYNKNGDYWLSVNRLIDHKRIEMQLKTFAKLPLEKLIIVGSFEKSRHWLKYNNYLNSIKPTNVEIKSFVTQKELIHLYANCKATITTSKDEDFGRLPIESMSSGKPVIAPNEGGYKETIIDGKTGVLINDINSDKIIDAINLISKNPRKYKNDCIKQAKRFDEINFYKKFDDVLPKIRK